VSVACRSDSGRGRWLRPVDRHSGHVRGRWPRDRRSATSGDHEVNVSGIYKGTVDPRDPTLPTGASIATGFVDLPATADVTNPAAGSQRLVARTDGLYVRDKAGAEVGPIGAGGSGIPATIIDAAGDLIIGTAADTAARLALGPSGQVLTSDGTTAAWAPTVPSIGYVSGDVYTLGGSTVATTAASVSAAGRWLAHPVWLPAGKYSGLSVYVSAAAVSTWRLGIYNGTPEAPTTLLHDCGTIATSPTTGQLIASSTFSITTTGLYWLAVLGDAYTATPTAHGWRGNQAEAPDLPYLGVRSQGVSAGGRYLFARLKTGVTTGAMPSPAPASLTWTDALPQIRAHAT